MVSSGVECSGPLSRWAGPLVVWLDNRGVCQERAVRTVRTFARFSSWMSPEGLVLADLDEDLVDEYVEAERRRSGSMVPAAVQYLPLVKRFFAAQGVMVLRGPPRRDRRGLPRLLVGPLSGVIVDLVGWLKTVGYARGTASSVACTAARLSAWMAAEGLGLERLDDELLTRFVVAQTRGSVPHPSSARRIVTVRKFLLSSGLVTDTVAGIEVPAKTPVSDCLKRWGQYLRVERGLGEATICEYQRWVRAFLTGLCGQDGSIRWDLVETRAVNRYVAAQGRGYSLASRRHLVTALRSLLTWAWVTAQLDRPMSAIVLRPPSRSADLPRALKPGQVEAIQATADTTTPIGLRDYAVVVMIARLGLRSGEVAALTAGRPRLAPRTPDRARQARTGCSTLKWPHRSTRFWPQLGLVLVGV
jgi:site-specific recombinase XerD